MPEILGNFFDRLRGKSHQNPESKKKPDNSAEELARDTVDLFIAKPDTAETLTWEKVDVMSGGLTEKKTETLPRTVTENAFTPDISTQPVPQGT